MNLPKNLRRPFALIHFFKNISVLAVYQASILSAGEKEPCPPDKVCSVLFAILELTVQYRSQMTDKQTHI